MTERKTLPEEIVVELRNLLISIVKKDTRNDTDTPSGWQYLMAQCRPDPWGLSGNFYCATTEVRRLH